jgi:tetratricopeptide (TPR) repeat protein
MPDPTVQTPPRRVLPRLLIGCGSLTALGLIGVFGSVWYFQHRSTVVAEQQQTAQAEKASEAFKPALDKLSGTAHAAPEPVDIDKTIRVIHEIDLALRNYDNFETYLQHVGQQDYRGVAPEVLDARRELLDQVRELYARQTQANEQQALWEYTKGMMLEVLSVVQAEGEWGMLGPTGSFSVDKQHAREILAEFRDQQTARARQIREIGQARDQLFEAMIRYSDVYYEHVEQWDRLCVLRDRAYLALADRDWETVEHNARAAMEMAPAEREAHLLAALAILHQGNPERFNEAADILARYVDNHPSRSAPALLLLGVLARERGELETARLNFQQASAYYPKQASHLTDMLDPYRMRAWLRKSRDGTLILESYKDTMLGAGMFSPELQLASVAFDRGDFEAGKRRVLDHFARRRAQQQWDFVLSDLAFAQDLLGLDTHRIFPEGAWLDLEISRPLLTSGLNVSVRNRTSETLRNATLVLLVQFTDMHPGDYMTFAAKTQSSVRANGVTSFGTIDVKGEVWGQPRGIDDVVRHRAILITDEAVLWVDTDDFRMAELERAERDRRQARPSSPDSWFKELTAKLDDVSGTLPHETIVDIVPTTFGRDGISFKLPRELAILRPAFRLSYGGRVLQASENRIEGDHIVLKFNAVDDFSQPDTGAMELGIRTVFGEVVLSYGRDGEMGYRFMDIRR